MNSFARSLRARPAANGAPHSHVLIMDVPTYSGTLFITDAAINIFPDLNAKRDIIQNAIDLFTQVGLGVRALPFFQRSRP